MNEELKTEMRNAVVNLVTRASKSERADDAMKLSQAALNAANAVCVLADADNKPSN